jgi:hypothetical protein
VDVLGVFAGGEHNNFQGGVPGLEQGQGVGAAHAGQADVEQQHLGHEPLVELGEHLLHAGDDEQQPEVGLPPQVRFQQGGQHHVVLHYS